MTPLELFEAIGRINPDSIQDSIQLSLDDTLASEAEQDNKAAHKNPVPAKAAGIREQPPAERRYGIALLPYLLTAGCTAACIAGFGLMIRFSMGNEIVGTQSEIPISVQESVSSMTTAVSTGERAVLTAITETHTVQQTVTVTAEDRTEPVSVTETDAVTEPAAAMTAMQTETLLLTETAAAKTQTETTVTEPPPPVYEMGDVDMDGQITFVDAALVYLDYNLALDFAHGEENLWECSPLTPEQRILGNVNGLDDGKMWTDAEPYPLSRDDELIIFHVAMYRNWYDIDITVKEYIQDPEFYDALADPDKYVQIYGEAWNQKLLDAVGLETSMKVAGIGWRWKEGVERRNVAEIWFSEDRELFMEYAMTVEEFWENTEVMKEQYFKDGWKEALLEENTNKKLWGNS